MIFRKVCRQFSESAHRIDRFAYWEACTTSGRNGDHDGSRTSPAKHIAQIVQRLIAAGRSPAEPLAFVTSATLEHQNVVESTLGTAVDDAKAAGVEPPAIICIGRSVLMRQVLDWRSLEAGAAPRNLDPLDRGRPAESA